VSFCHIYLKNLLTNSSVRKTTMLSNTLPKDPSITSGQVHTTSPKLMIYTEGLTPSSLKHSFSLDGSSVKDLDLGLGFGYTLLRIDASYSVMSMSTSH
jgi:hypothetical protein